MVCHTTSLVKKGNPEVATKTHSQPIAPILRNSPKDWATLYTVLSMSQDISAKIVGPNHRVIITLDMDLYKTALQLQMSVKNKKMAFTTRAPAQILCRPTRIRQNYRWEWSRWDCNRKWRILIQRIERYTCRQAIQTRTRISYYERTSNSVS